MKILITKREELTLPDGISQFIFSVADGLIRLGHEVVCATTCDTDLERKVRERYQFRHYPQLEALVEGGPMTYLQRFMVWAKRGRALAARHRPDLVIVNGAIPVRFQYPSVLVAHDVEPRRAGPLGDFTRIVFKAITYRLTTKLVTTCPELVAPVARECRCRPEHVGVIPTCVDTTQYSPRPLGQRQPFILHAGQQVYKQPEASLAALAVTRHPSARLVVLGKQEPAFAAALAKAPAALRQRVEIPGIVSAERLKELQATARIISVPSHYIFPVASPTALEGLANHTPMVLSPCISTIIARAGSCFVERTDTGMAGRFDDLLNRDDLWEAMSAQCAKDKIRFDSVTVAKEYLELFRPG
jgi:glycosyltransferase involved in cell wall biosynthesis